MNKTINKISVIPNGNDPKSEHLKSEISHFLHIDVSEVRVVKNFYVQGLNDENTLTVAKKVVSCPVTEQYKINDEYYSDYKTRIEIGPQPGVMNPESETVIEELHQLGLENFDTAAITYTYCFNDDKLEENQILEIKNRILMNTQIQAEIFDGYDDLNVILKAEKFAKIAIREMNDEELMELSDYKFFLTLVEMKTIQNYYKDLGRDAYDVELETLAQTWSEHCGHKTFKANVVFDGVEKPSMWKMVKNSEKDISHEDVISKFEDNSGVFRFATDSDGVEHGICIKAETHNSPSGLDPYGGAMTGSGGVFRDIAGTGKGAKNISSINIFCLGDPDLEMKDVLPGCLHPRRILTGVVEGVRDYGNRIGIPTNNGSFHFHKDFGPKPTVLVGADGIVPLKYAKKGKAAKGQKIISFGGKTGKDGIHGATFSSAEMTEKTSTLNSGAVQIGNPIEEKRTFDCLIEIRDKNIIDALTDCGAGGYSSAVGEMGEDTGAVVYLDKIPLKYPGLSSYEKWISESQERMVALIDESNISIVDKISKKYNVEYAIIGEITDTKNLVIYDNDELVCDLSMEFLHDGQPTETIYAKSYKKDDLKDGEFYEEEIDYNEAIKDIIGHLNICSKEPVIRQYDHGVQGTNVDGPLSGKNNDGPTGGAVMKPLANSDAALVLGHGLNPVLNKIDAYKGSLWAFYESISNIVALGGNPDKTFMIENYIWPKPTEKNLSDLYEGVRAVTDASKFFKTPIISGKDSLSSTYKYQDIFIEVPPVVCMGARSVVDDYRKTISPDLKKAGNPILLVGHYKQAYLGGSIFFDSLINPQLGTQVPEVKMEIAKEIYDLMYKHIQAGNIVSASDVSEGGMITAAIEMAIGGKKGLSLNVRDKVKTLFAEVPAAFVVEVKDLDAADELIDSELAVQIGTVTSKREIVVNDGKKDFVQLHMDELEDIWKKPFTKYFG